MGRSRTSEAGAGSKALRRLKVSVAALTAAAFVAPAASAQTIENTASVDYEDAGLRGQVWSNTDAFEVITDYEADQMTLMRRVAGAVRANAGTIAAGGGSVTLVFDVTVQ